MKLTLAFDVYGTLINTHGVIEELRKHIGDAASDFSNTWRSKQLEYSFRRGLMERYQHFLKRAKAVAEEAWLISSNPFDVIGSLSTGMHAAWIRRTPDAIFDPWEFEPTIIVSSIIELANQLTSPKK